MLAIQCIHINWSKDCRNAKSAEERAKLWKPKALSSDVKLKGKGVFLNKWEYVQDSFGIRSLTDSKNFRQAVSIKEQIKGYTKNKGELYRKTLLRLNEIGKKNKGVFTENISELILPGIEINQNDKEYECIWFSLDESRYVPVRKGKNINFNNKTSRAFGKRIKCVKAFTLVENEGGIIRFNYRVRGWHGGYTYSEYMFYIVNTGSLYTDTFLRYEYSKSHEEMADLF
ncbi:MAG: hypothetical protein IJS61_06650 [Firmicutes bacterium]|nr:hypothetical protein [Bacillota bacterium]